MNKGTGWWNEVEKRRKKIDMWVSHVRPVWIVKLY